MPSLIYVLVSTVFVFQSSSGSSDSDSSSDASSEEDTVCNTESWETVSSASLSPSRRNSAVLVNECEILLFGGLNGGVPNTTPTVTSLNTLSSNNPIWTELGPVADDMNGPWFPTTQGAVFVDNNIYITCEDAADGKIWEYKRNDNSFNVINDDNRMIFPSEDCCAFGVNNEIYIFGGQRFGTSYDNVQIYNIDRNEWRLGNSMNIAREDMGCTIVDDRYVYLFGGAQGSDVLNSVEKYDIVDDTWQFFENSLNPARRSLSAKYIPDTNEILLVGGDFCFDQGACPTDGSNFLSSIDVWNTDTEEVDANLSDKYPDLVRGRGGLAFAIIDNNKCYGTGSGDSDSDSDESEENRSLTFYAIGGEEILDALPWAETETLCFQY